MYNFFQSFNQWFNALDQAAQTNFVNSLISSTVIAFVAVLGFIITVITSTLANKRVVQATNSAVIKQIDTTAEAKIAEFRTGWIDEFRRDLSRLIRINASIIEAKNKYDRKSITSSQYEIYEEEFRVRSAMISGRLLLRLNPESKNEDEISLEKILDKSSDLSITTPEIQRDIINLSRRLLKQEWEKVKRELRKVEEGTKNVA